MGKVDILVLLKHLWNRRRFIFWVASLFFLLSSVWSILAPKEFTSSITFVPRLKAKENAAGLSNIAALAGINIGQDSNSEIGPNLYPTILKSIPFQRDLASKRVYFSTEQGIYTIQEYYEEIYNPGFVMQAALYIKKLPRTVLNALKPQDGTISEPNYKESHLIFVTEEEKQLFKLLSENLSIDVNDKEGYIKIVAKMPDPVGVSEFVNIAQKQLQEFVIRFKLQKLDSELAFIEERYNEKRAEFEALQNELAIFLDRNQSLTTAKAQTEYKKLQADHDMALSVYTELARQLETAKIKVKEDTPEFTIVQPSIVPIERSKPQRVKLVLLGTFLGLLFASTYVLLIDRVRAEYSRWKNL